MLRAFRPAAACVGEEALEDTHTVIPQHPAGDFAAVIQVRCLEQVPEAPRSAAFNIWAAKNHPPHPAVNDGPRTHRAGLLRHIQIAIRQPPVTHFALCLSQRLHFRMGGGILQRLDQIPRSCNHALFMHDHRPDGHLILGGRLARHSQRLPHEMVVAQQVDGKFWGHPKVKQHPRGSRKRNLVRRRREEANPPKLET